MNPKKYLPTMRPSNFMFLIGVVGGYLGISSALMRPNVVNSVDSILLREALDALLLNRAEGAFLLFICITLPDTRRESRRERRA